MQPDLIEPVIGNKPRLSAVLVCFPQGRNVGKARHVARTFLSQRSPQARSGYWRETCQTFARVLGRRGFSDTEINRQLAAFRLTVKSEVAGLQKCFGFDGALAEELAIDSSRSGRKPAP